MGITNYGLEQMGFERIPDGERIEAHFKSINVYGIRGINSDDKSPLSPEELKHVLKEFSFSLGDCVNAICRALFDGDFVEDEKQWQETCKSPPPYLIVLSSLSDPFICEQGYWKHENEKIVTYNCFPEAKEELRISEKQNTSRTYNVFNGSFFH
jgi:hypothetical protein